MHFIWHTAQTKTAGTAFREARIPGYIDKLIGALIRSHDEQLIAYPRGHRIRYMRARVLRDRTQKPMLDRKDICFLKELIRQRAEPSAREPRAVSERRAAASRRAGQTMPLLRRARPTDSLKQ